MIRLINMIWTEMEYWNRMNVNSILATGLPVHEADYTKYKGFQGKYVHLSFIEMGTDGYEPWNTGCFIRSLYILPEEFRKLISIFTPEPVTLQLLLLLPM